MRREQAGSGEQEPTLLHYYLEGGPARPVPRFLWNAKMRFGRPATSTKIAKKLGAKRVLVEPSSMP